MYTNSLPPRKLFKGACKKINTSKEGTLERINKGNIFFSNHIEWKRRNKSALKIPIETDIKKVDSKTPKSRERNWWRKIIWASADVGMREKKDCTNAKLKIGKSEKKDNEESIV